MQPVSSFNLFTLIPLAVGLLLAIAGVAFLYAGIRSRRQAAAAVEWPSASGRILRTKIHEHIHQDRETGPYKTYEPVIEYEYSLMGTPMHGSRYSFGVKRYNNRTKAKTFLEQYQPDSIITVFYNPQDTTQAVIEREASGSITYLALGTVFLLIGLGIGCLASGATAFLSSFVR